MSRLKVAHEPYEPLWAIWLLWLPVILVKWLMNGSWLTRPPPPYEPWAIMSHFFPYQNNSIYRSTSFPSNNLTTTKHRQSQERECYNTPNKKWIHLQTTVYYETVDYWRGATNASWKHVEWSSTSAGNEFQVLETLTTSSMTNIINDNLMNATIHQKKDECSNHSLTNCCKFVSDRSLTSEGIEEFGIKHGCVGLFIVDDITYTAHS